MEGIKMTKYTAQVINTHLETVAKLIEATAKTPAEAANILRAEMIRDVTPSQQETSPKGKVKNSVPVRAAR